MLLKKNSLKSIFILLGIVVSLSSCEFKEYKPFDNAIEAMNAKDSTEKLSREITERNNIKLDSLLNGK